MLHRIAFLLLCTMAIASCGQTKARKQQMEKQELELLATEVMVVHDRVMPETGKIFQLKKKLMAIEATLTDSLEKKEIYRVVGAMEEADDAMMDWMHTYRAPDELLPFDKQKIYYKLQKVEIEEIEKKILTSIAEANILIDTYEKK